MAPPKSKPSVNAPQKSSKQKKRLLRCQDFTKISPHQILCGFCNSKISATQFATHLRSSHGNLVDLGDEKIKDQAEKLIFRLRIMKELSCEIPDGSLRFLNSAHLRCPSCHFRIALHGSFAPENLIRHIKSNVNDCLTKLKPQKRQTYNENTPETSSDEDDGMTEDNKNQKVLGTTKKPVAIKSKSVGKPKPGRPCKEPKQSLAKQKLKKAMKLVNQQAPPSSVSALKKAAESGRMEQRKETEKKYRKREDGAILSSAKAPVSNRIKSRIHTEEAMTTATVVYRYLKNEGSKIFLNRNLSYLRPSPSRTRKNKKPQTIDSFMAENGISMKDQAKNPGIPRYRLQLESPRRLDTKSKYVGAIEVEIFAQKFNSNTYNPAKLAKASGSMVVLGSVSFPQRWAESSDEPKFVNLPSNLFQPLNGHVEWSTWLFFRVKMTKQLNSVVSGGRSLRKIPERMASLTRLEPPRKKRCVQTQTPSSSSESDSDDDSDEESGVYLGHRMLICGSEEGSETYESLSGFPGDPIDITLVKTDCLDQDVSKALETLKRLIQSATGNNELSTMGVTLFVEKDGFIQHKKRIRKLTSCIREENSQSGESDGFPIPRRLLYRFIMKAGAEEEGYSTEPDSPECCPWCSSHFTDLFCLLKHLRCVHSRFDIVYKPSASIEELPCIDVMVNDSFDGSYEGHLIRQYMLVKPVGPINPGMSSELFVWRRRKSERKLGSDRTLVEFLEPEFNCLGKKRGHIRQYFSCKTMEPIRNLAEKEDSESERAPEWFQEHVFRQLEDFSDLNSAEKVFLKMWNFHAFKHPIVADLEFFKFCELFVREQGEEIIGSSLRDNFGLHMAHMAFLGLISKKELGSLIAQLRAFDVQPDLSSANASPSRSPKRKNVK